MARKANKLGAPINALESAKLRQLLASEGWKLHADTKRKATSIRMKLYQTRKVLVQAGQLPPGVMEISYTLVQVGEVWEIHAGKLALGLTEDQLDAAIAMGTPIKGCDAVADQSSPNSFVNPYAAAPKWVAEQSGQTHESMRPVVRDFSEILDAML